MTSLEHSFQYMLDQVNEFGREYMDDVQVGLRVDAQVVAGLDALGKVLHLKRAGVAREIVSAGIHDALRVAGLEYWFQPGDADTPGTWHVVPIGSEGPELSVRMTSDTGE